MRLKYDRRIIELIKRRLHEFIGGDMANRYNGETMRGRIKSIKIDGEGFVEIKLRWLACKYGSCWHRVRPRPGNKLEFGFSYMAVNFFEEYRPIPDHYNCGLRIKVATSVVGTFVLYPKGDARLKKNDLL